MFVRHSGIPELTLIGREMKKRQQISNIKSNAHRTFLALSALRLGQVAQAQTQVVVSPLFGDDIPAVSHSIQTLFTNSFGMPFNTLSEGSFTMSDPDRATAGTVAPIRLRYAVNQQLLERGNNE